MILAIDIGRTMLAEIDGIQKLDYAINAALLLAYVATLSEDRVGLLLFAGDVKTYLPPKKGRGQVFAIMEALYNAKASFAEPDYRRALGYLRARWRKRSLIVCFTDLWDAKSSRTTINELASLQPRHLVAAVALLDTKVLRTARQEINTPEIGLPESGRQPGAGGPPQGDESPGAARRHRRQLASRKALRGAGEQVPRRQGADDAVNSWVIRSGVGHRFGPDDGVELFCG